MEYTFLYAPNIERIVQIHHLIPDLVKAIIVESYDTFACFEDEENCILSGENPDGIPAWKLFSLHFWTGADNPLGSNWTFSPEDYRGPIPNTYLGYSVEPSCLQQPFVPHVDRQDRAYIMAKQLDFVLDPRQRAWPPHFYQAASHMTGIQFVLGAGNSDAYPDPPPGVTNYGQMAQPVFLNNLSRSRVLVGVGSPITSPTPYDSLCLGVPFINPISDWNRDDPKDRTKWWTQHGPLQSLDPPFVYNVFQDDLDGFVAAIKSAMLHPIDRHVLDHMRMSSLSARLRAILETDWKSEAAKLLAQRRAAGEGPLFTL